MSQHEAILKYLKKNKTITPMEAFWSLGITKLSTRVGELSRAGYVFKKERIKVKTRRGEAYVMRYSLVDWSDVA